VEISHTLTAVMSQEKEEINGAFVDAIEKLCLCAEELVDKKKKLKTVQFSCSVLSGGISITIN